MVQNNVPVATFMNQMGNKDPNSIARYDSVTVKTSKQVIIYYANYYFYFYYVIVHIFKEKQCFQIINSYNPVIIQ